MNMHGHGVRSLMPVALALAFMVLPAPVFPASADSEQAQVGAPVEVDLDLARRIAGSVFGLDISGVEQDSSAFRFSVSGFSDSRRCPLSGLRNLSCESFEWIPSRITIYRKARQAPVSGHLARNLVVMVDMESDSVGFAIGTLHGVLVTPSGGLSAGRPCAFGWYLSRSGYSIGMSVRDVSGDGAADVVYSYGQVLPRGVSIAVRDVWSFPAMAATKFISSGEKLSGVIGSTFEGVPIHLSSDDRTELGRFVFLSGDSGRTAVPGSVPAGILAIERLVLTPPVPVWEFQVIGDTGGGWLDFLAIQGSIRDDEGPVAEPGLLDRMDPESAEMLSGDRCTMSDLPTDLSVQIRRALLDAEDTCRVASAGVPASPVAASAAAMLIRGFALAWKGWPLLAASFFEAASVELLASGRALPAVAASWFAALGTVSAVEALCGEDAAGSCEAGGIDPLHGLYLDSVARIAAGAMDGLRGVVDRMVEGLRKLPE
ncbi:MAG TPA: hypothetical protein PKH54_01345 [Myxococcota bacterium]|nr:hypothetical protein [Myxococcota bacterium]HOC98559.1 hypothetical protein [Myxococcota bacterium]HPV05056.1 hypothetical protein [Myxococcota bacterium]